MQTRIISHASKEDRDAGAVNLMDSVAGVSPTHSDVFVVTKEDKKKKISIEQVREIIRFVNIRPTNSDYKIVWIQEAQSLSVEAQNALLKVLEEPPEYALMLLTVDHDEHLLDTIRSRAIVTRLGSRNEIRNDEVLKLQVELVELLDSNIGVRIDWVTNHKENFKDAEYVSVLFYSWKLMLRDLMLIAMGDNPDAEVSKEVFKLSQGLTCGEWKGELARLQKIALACKNNNANVSLGIESFLVACSI